MPMRNITRRRASRATRATRATALAVTAAAILSHTQQSVTSFQLQSLSLRPLPKVRSRRTLSRSSSSSSSSTQRRASETPTEAYESANAVAPIKHPNDALPPTIPLSDNNADVISEVLESASPPDVLIGAPDAADTVTTAFENNGALKASSDASKHPPCVPTVSTCLSFLLPALGIYAAPPLLSLIDAAFLGRTSSVHLAALGPASSISDSASLPLLFLSIAGTNLMAKATADEDGEGMEKRDGREESRRRITRACLGLGSIGGTMIAAAVFFKRHWLSALYCGEIASTTATLTPYCMSYVAIRSLALPFVVLASIAQAVCIGIKDTTSPMVAVLVAAGLNLVGDWIMVCGFGWGIAGAAWATSISQICAAGLLLRVLGKRGLLRGSSSGGKQVRQKDMETIPNPDTNKEPSVSCERGTWDILRSILGFIPFLFVMAVKIGMHNTAAATAASLGGAAAAAHTALFAVGMLCFTFGDTGSSLSQAFLPAFASSNECEEGVDINDSTTIDGGGKRSKTRTNFDIEAAKPTIRRLLSCTLGVSATVVALSTALLTVFAGQITNDPAVLYQMRRALPLMAGTLCLHGTAVTLEGLLLAQRNFTALSAVYSVVALTVGASLAYVRSSGVGLLGVWATYVWFQLSRVVAFSALGGLLPKLKLPAQLKPFFMRRKTLEKLTARRIRSRQQLN